MSLQQAVADCQTILGLPDLETGFWYESPDNKVRRYVYEIHSNGLCRIGANPRSVVPYTAFVGWHKLPGDYKGAKAFAEEFGYVWKDKPD